MLGPMLVPFCIPLGNRMSLVMCIHIIQPLTEVSFLFFLFCKPGSDHLPWLKKLSSKFWFCIHLRNYDSKSIISVQDDFRENIKYPRGILPYISSGLLSPTLAHRLDFFYQFQFFFHSCKSLLAPIFILRVIRKE